MSGKEPKRQRTLVNILFGALALVVVGSLTGEYLAWKGSLGQSWWWLGTQGREYLELGRLIESFQHGFWSARSLAFHQQPAVNMLLRLRVIPDTVFIFASAIPIVAASIWGLIGMRAEKPIEQPLGELRDRKPAAAPVYRRRIRVSRSSALTNMGERPRDRRACTFCRLASDTR